MPGGASVALGVVLYGNAAGEEEAVPGFCGVWPPGAAGWGGLPELEAFRVVCSGMDGREAGPVAADGRGILRETRFPGTGS